MTFLTILLSGVECAVVLREDIFSVVGQGSRWVKEVKSSSFAGWLAESACRAVKKRGNSNGGPWTLRNHKGEKS